jgi:hypothetical protein
MAFEALKQSCRDQARIAAGMGAPFSAGVIELIVAGLGDGGPFDSLFAPWARSSLERVNADAAGLRLLAGFHDLVLAGDASDLAEDYPDRTDAPEWDRLGRRLSQAAERHHARLSAFMASPPQTNEAGRSLCLFGGFLETAAATGLPLRCLELGASAGLNQIWDRYRYELGEGRGWGDPGSPVVLAGAWSGGAPPLDTPVRVAERRACDQAPIDLSDPAAARRLQAYVWAEQGERLQRLRAAIALARTAGVRVEAADAGDWAQAHATPRPGVATVLYHSVFWQYAPPATQAAMARTIAGAGAAASREAPFAWLRMEPDSAYVFEVRLTLWPGDEERRLAVVHPHGAEVEWC